MTQVNGKNFLNKCKNLQKKVWYIVPVNYANLESQGDLEIYGNFYKKTNRRAPLASIQPL